MILIADSGSTKTDWVIIETKSVQKHFFQGLGLNPYYSTKKSIADEVIKLFQSIDYNSVTHIFFYGSGCSTDANKQIIKEGLKTLFSKSAIEVYHDMEGAARALCKNTKGIACILGTGSNAALYDGNTISNSAVSLGYLLGDEGSGNQMGKQLIRAIFLKTAPKNSIREFNKTYHLSVEDLLNEIYHKPNPNRFLASFAKYINQQKDDPFILDLIYKTFSEFIHLVVTPLNPKKDLPIHFTGSISWFFRQELEAVLIEKGFIPGIISQKPIDNLIDYHLAHYPIQ
ncbi:MAG: ATPase [Bacteroidales bacterium]|nr:ATPase [Bacteroidales bacterium]